MIGARKISTLEPDSTDRTERSLPTPVVAVQPAVDVAEDYLEQ